MTEQTKTKTPTFESLTDKVVDWGKERGIVKYENRNQQMLKCVSEIGELADALIKYKPTEGELHYNEEIEDAMGDTLVTLILLGEDLGLDLVKSLDVAYGIIKNRTGKNVNGVFVKD